MKAIKQALFSTGLQNPKFTAEETKVNVSQITLNKNTVNLGPDVGFSVYHTTKRCELCVLSWC